MTCSYNDIISQKHKNRNPFVSELRFMFGGEGEIRTLEPCYRLHDFQSCALDQLGDFSKSFCSTYILYHNIKRKSIPFDKFFYLFLRLFLLRQSSATADKYQSRAFPIPQKFLREGGAGGESFFHKALSP